MGGFSRPMVRQKGVVREAGAGDQYNKKPYVVGDVALTLTAAVLAGGLVVGAPGSARTYTIDTASNLLATETFADMDIGDSYEFLISNQTAATHAITFAVATGVTLLSGGVANYGIAAASTKHFLLIKASATTFNVLAI